MFTAAVGGNRDVAHLLLRNGCNVNKIDKDGKAALMIAVVNGHQAMVELLLQKGADITLKNEVGAFFLSVLASERPTSGRHASNLC